MKNKYLLYLATGAIALATVGTVAISTVSADTSVKTNPMTNLVNVIAEKFNLNPSDVQQVFTDQKAQMQVKMQQKETDKLNQAVTAGKLTQDQANKITAKKAELESEQSTLKTSLQGKTKTEIQAAMKGQMDSLKQWATDNNIPMQYLMFGGFKGPRGGFGFDMHRLMPTTK